MKKISLLLIAALFVALSSSCFSPYTAEATITLSLAGSSQPNNSESRAVIGTYPPDISILNQIDYVAVFSGTGGNQTFTAKGGTIIRGIVPPGTYTIDIKATINGERYATGTHTGFEAKAGNNMVQMHMNKWLYELGDTGPGGGIIFYINTGGFQLYGFTSPEDKTAHYFECAPVHLPGTYEWQTPTNSSTLAIDTTNGSGKRNTTYILDWGTAAAGRTTPPATACANYTNNGKADWFLPSFFEFDNIFASKSITGIVLTGSSYWTSSEFNATDAYRFNSDRTSTSDAKTYLCSVRPIRAF